MLTSKISWRDSVHYKDSFYSRSGSSSCSGTIVDEWKPGHQKCVSQSLEICKKYTCLFPMLADLYFDKSAFSYSNSNEKLLLRTTNLN